ncbi:MAG: YbbR-like domain-containing protein [Flavobacteriaceae bacterium]|nr:YbbR-like domain-containing protein [Flavobacteriaceae bacterium]
MKRVFNDILKSLSTKKFRTFSLFFFISLLLWFFTKLSDTYTVEQEVALEFYNIPNEKQVNNQALKVPLQISASGFRLLGLNVINKTIKVDIINDLKVDKGQYFWLPESNLGKIKESFDGLRDINLISTDPILIDIGENAKKKVAIKLMQTLSFKNGYEIRDRITIKPDSVEVYGPSKVLDSISYIETESLIMEDLEDNISVSLGLNSEEKIKLSQKEIEVSALIEEYVYNELSIPIRVINTPEELKVNIFPKEVKVSFRSPISFYNKLEVNDFHLVCDFAEKELSTMKIKLTEFPNQLKDIKVKNNNVEYVVVE